MGVAESLLTLCHVAQSALINVSYHPSETGQQTSRKVRVVLEPVIVNLITEPVCYVRIPGVKQ
jgi:hypothetical protein